MLRQTPHRQAVDPDHPGAADLHRRQIAAMARIIRRAAAMIEQGEAQGAGG